MGPNDYEAVCYSGLTDDEKAFLSLDDCFSDVQYQQLNLIKMLTLREIEVLRDLNRLRVDKDRLSSDYDLIDVIVKLENALTACQALKLRAIESLHEMQIDKYEEDMN